MSSKKHKKWWGYQSTPQTPKAPPVVAVAAAPSPVPAVAAPAPAAPAPPMPPPEPLRSGLDEPPEAAQIRDLIAHGKCKVAVDRAKEIHKRHNSTASEGLLVEAYEGRIVALLESGLGVEARSLADLVRERHPSSAGGLEDLEWRMAARAGNLDFLGLLAEPGLSERRRARIESVIRRDVASLEAVAGCGALPADHPLRQAAAALGKAFIAVTSGPVQEEALALSEVSRRSPLAPWKMLVLAIAALYRRDNEACRRYVEAIEPGSAPARLKPVLVSLLGGKLSPPLASGKLPGQARLVARVSGNLGLLRGLLRETDKAIERVRGGEKPARALTLARETLKMCGEALPELVAELREQLLARLSAAGVQPRSATSALGGVSPDSPNFLRLMALAGEKLDRESDILAACGVWDEFRRSALKQKWLSEKSFECGALYLHMASLLAPIPAEELAHARQRVAELRGGAFGGEEFPAALLDTYYADPRELYRRACASDPHTEAFERWLDWEKRNGDPRGAEEAAELWRRSLPQDIPPLLYLMDATEERGALEKSLGYIARAEALDGLNADVRRARLRLLFRTATRQLRDRRAHLAFERLAGIAALPQLQQGDRPALLAALQWASAGISGRSQEAEERLRHLRAALDPAASALLEWNVAKMCRWREGWPDLAFQGDRAGLAAGAGRVCALGDDLGLEFEIPSEWVDDMARLLSRGEARIETPHLLALGEAALRRQNMRLAYAVSAAGLARDGASEARFLFLRACALPGSETERRNQCLSAVIALARRQRDTELAAEAIEVRQGKRATGRRSRRWREEEPLEESDLAIGPEHLSALLEQERGAHSYPASAADRPRYVAEFAEACNCPACRQMRGQPAFEEGPGDLPSPPIELVKEIERMLFSMEPEEALGALSELAEGLGVPLPPVPRTGRRKRRYRKDDLF